MATFHFHLVAPDKMTFEGEVDQVDVPGSEGDFGVLAGHAPFISLLRPGILTVHVGSTATKMVVLGGFAEVSEDGGFTVLAEVADKAEGFDPSRIMSEIERLQQRVEAMEPGDELDHIIARIDHFRAVREHINGTAMH